MNAGRHLLVAVLAIAGCKKLGGGAPAGLVTKRSDLPLLIGPEATAAATPPPTAPGAMKPVRIADKNGKRKQPKPAGAAGLVAASPQPQAYALIIGIDSYRDVIAAPGAAADADRMVQVARKTLGVPEKNVHLLKDQRASRSDIVKQLRWLQGNVKSGSRIYFFFSGHGAPNVNNGAAFILPWDGDPRFLEDTAIAMSTVVSELEKTKAKDVLVIADSCFSGAGGRSVLPPGARPLVRVQKPSAPQAKVAMLSAASGAEISGPNAKGDGGLFTTHLVAALGRGAADMNGDGQISLKELEEWIGPRVARDAKRDNREQNPSLLVGKQLGDADAFIVGWGYPAK